MNFNSQGNKNGTNFSEKVTLKCSESPYEYRPCNFIHSLVLLCVRNFHLNLSEKLCHFTHYKSNFLKYEDLFYCIIYDLQLISVFMKIFIKFLIYENEFLYFFINLFIYFN